MLEGQLSTCQVQHTKSHGKRINGYVGGATAVHKTNVSWRETKVNRGTGKGISTIISKADQCLLTYHPLLSRLPLC